MNFIRQYVRFNNEKTNELFEKNIDKINPKTYPMGIEEILLHQAETRGIEKGIEKAQVEEKKKFTISLILSTDFDDAKIASLVGVTTEYVSQLRASI